LDNLNVLCNKYELCVFIIHHVTKANKQNKQPSKDNAVGTQAFEAEVLTMLYLKKFDADKKAFPSHDNERQLHFTRQKRE
jgi:hypothetical protein